LDKIVAINALPDALKIADALEELILNPSQIAAIGENARAFIEKEHHYIRSAEKYIDKWRST